MPIKIQTGAGSTDPMVISQDDYATGRLNFQQHYYLANCNSIFGGQDLTIPWATLNAAVNAFCTQYSLSPSVVALRFVYCYDVASNSLYLRLQLCQMQQSSPGSNSYNLLAAPVAWYQITNGSMVATQVTDLSDPVYLGNFYYSENAVCSASALQPLSGDGGQTYVRTITYPWQNEVYQMYVDNQGTANFQFSIGACSYVRPDSTTECMWPHGLVLYLRTAAGIPLLDNSDYIVMFHNKGADYGTMCPTHCDVYIAPPVVSAQQTDVSQTASA